MSERRSQKSQRNRRLKRQPKLRRVDALATPIPSTVVPRVVARRRRRNRQPFKFPTASVMGALASPRWVSLGILLLCLYTLNFVGSQTDYYFTKIPVQGVFSITPDEIVTTSGLAGQHVFAVDPEVAAEKIAATPGVLGASVSVTWPNQVSIEIKEDQPVAIWEQQGVPYWVNQSGALFPARINVPGLLRIHTDYPDAILGTMSENEAAEIEGEIGLFDVGAVPEELIESAFLLKKLSPNGQELNRLAYQPGQGLSFEDERGWDVYLGVGVDMSQKLAVYNALVDELASQGLTPLYIDVSNPAKPFYRVNEGAEQS